MERNIVVRREKEKIKHYGLELILMLTAVVFCLLACSLSVGGGVKKDFTTGLTTTYKNMQTEETLLVMNDEVIHHTDIPLGESMLLVNKGVSGLVEKEGKVSTGCSLEITDSAGNILMQEPDLFAGNDIFDAKNATVLKCTINTGAPMKWDETYTAKVVFWDKYGKGNIRNEVKINMIDIP
ncbi:MAG: hypothetical protein V4717_20790 [Bacteroidota bacterium]